MEKGAKRPTAIDLHKLWVAEVKSEKEWTYEVSKCSPQQSFRNLDEAFKKVFKVKEVKPPRFKKKGIKDSFYLEGSNFYVWADFFSKQKLKPQTSLKSYGFCYNLLYYEINDRIWTRCHSRK